VQLTDTTAQTLDLGFDLDDITRVDRMPETNPLDAPEQRNSPAVLGLGENQDRSNLRDALGQDRRGKRGPLPGLM